MLASGCRRGGAAGCRDRPGDVRRGRPEVVGFGRAPVAVLAGLGRRGGGRPLGRAGVGWWSAFVTRGGRDRGAGCGVCGDARGPCRVGCWRPVGGSCRRDRPGGQPSRRSGASGVSRAGAEPGRAGGRDVGRRVRPQGARAGPPHLPRRRPPPPREAPVAAHGSSLDGPRGHVPHPDQPRSRSRRKVVRRVRRRRRRREGQARRSPHVRPAQGRRVHGDGHRRHRRLAHGVRQSCSCSSTSRPSATGLHEASICETYDGHPLPPATVRRLACEAEIIPIVLEATGESSTSDEPNASRQPTNAEHSVPCTRPAPRPTAPSASATATSTTSKNGSKEATRTSRT